MRIVRWERADPPSQEEAEARLHQEGYESFKWYDVPGACYRKHVHKQDECIWILRGELIFEIEDQKYSLKTGDRLYLPAKLPHTAEVSKNGSVTYLVGQKA
ncbi:MAG: cupin domain-containing protein [Bdellovibrionia bacterium]